jgi:hypothetical protein
VIHEPVSQRTSTLGSQILDDGLHRLERVQQVELFSAQRSIEPSQSIKPLHPKVRCTDDFPAQTAGRDFSAGQKFH